MKILVTGGAGYIGSLLVPRLVQEGFFVRVIDNFMYQQNSLLDCCHFPNFELVHGDVRDAVLLKRNLKDIDFVLPLACLTGAPLCEKNPIDAKSVNSEAIETILQSRSSNQGIIFPTTNSGYGAMESVQLCTEETPLHPISLYGKLKVESERRVLNAGEAITLRLATVFGASPRMRLDLLVNDFVHRAFHDQFLVLFESHFKRNYIHIRDVVDAFLFCLRNFDRLKNQAYNVGLNEANLSKLELCQRIQRHLPQFRFWEAEVGSDPDKRNYIVSNDKINRMGLEAKRGLDEGIVELLKSFQVIKSRPYRNI